MLGVSNSGAFRHRPVSLKSPALLSTLWGSFFWDSLPLPSLPRMYAEVLGRGWKATRAGSHPHWVEWKVCLVGATLGRGLFHIAPEKLLRSLTRFYKKSKAPTQLYREAVLHAQHVVNSREVITPKESRPFANDETKTRQLLRALPVRWRARPAVYGGGSRPAVAPSGADTIEMFAEKGLRMVGVLGDAIHTGRPAAVSTPNAKKTRRNYILFLAR